VGFRERVVLSEGGCCLLRGQGFILFVLLDIGRGESNAFSAVVYCCSKV